jgi:hypothetical protein
MNRKDLMPAQSCATCAKYGVGCVQQFSFTREETSFSCPDWRLSVENYEEACHDRGLDPDEMLARFREKGGAA